MKQLVETWARAKSLLAAPQALVPGERRDVRVHDQPPGFFFDQYQGDPSGWAHVRRLVVGIHMPPAQETRNGRLTVNRHHGIFDHGDKIGFAAIESSSRRAARCACA